MSRPKPGKSTHAEALEAALDGLGPLARQLNQLHTRLWYEQVHQDLTGPQFTVLSLLELHGDMDQGTLGAAAHLDKSTAAPLLERLRGRGLLEIEKDERDRRRKLVRITDGGRRLVARLAPGVIDVSDQLLEGLSTGEREEFLRLLRRVTAR
ncbi:MULTISPECIES: MarR family winged helix-turn-helix transcriptional regulator [unclassified Streptomyces]|uniref:MarR family winged helix-turn-helix transcriptional regulator n=1 Tax=unclassified Streptomyces TaxID=2593676 RepID=UPI00278BC7A2|nr:MULTISPECIES: MarR family transcriptional regulator [unclassified Streptomyces]